VNGLHGMRVLVTRPPHQARAFIDKLSACGAVPFAFPTIKIVPLADQSRLDKALTHLAAYDWLIFTSQNAVDVFWERYSHTQAGETALNRLKTAAIGPATARALAKRGIHTDYVPDEYIAEAVAAGVGDVQGKRILLPRAAIAREALVIALQQRGAVVDEIPIYQTIFSQPEAQTWQALEEGMDFITFTSSSTVHGFFEAVGARAGELVGKAAVACIGPITAQTVAEYGFPAQLIAEEYTTDGLIAAMLRYSENNKGKDRG
jgi:uroporphyrinogen III methyltransferase / synthase